MQSKLRVLQKNSLQSINTTIFPTILVFYVFQIFSKYDPPDYLTFFRKTCSTPCLFKNPIIRDLRVSDLSASTSNIYLFIYNTFYCKLQKSVNYHPCLEVLSRFRKISLGGDQKVLILKRAYRSLLAQLFGKQPVLYRLVFYKKFYVEKTSQIFFKGGDRLQKRGDQKKR